MNAEVNKVSLAPQIPRSWELGEFIDKGSFANVYLLKDPTRPSDKKFIVKEIQSTKAKKDKRSNFSEIEIYRSLNHIRIVPFYGSEEREYVLYIFLGYMKKGSLANYIAGKETKRLLECETKIFTRQILEGVSYLHSQNPPIIHRDIKGKNILLEDERNIKLTDFGLSKIINENTNARSSVGTYKWMAPEVINITKGNNSYDLKADVWSIGCTVVEMATGSPPFPNLSSFQALIQIGNGVQPEYNLLDDSSEEIRDFLSKIFLTDPKKRPTCDDLLRHEFAIEHCLSPAFPERSCKGNLIGMGRFGKVYLVTDLNKEKLYAVKEINVRPGDREMIMQLIRQEEKILNKVHHPRIVEFFGYKELNNLLSIYMGYMPMGSLEDYLAKFGCCSEDKAKLYTRQILEGVHYLHENGIIHKDITGKHVLMENETRIKLGGFSVSKTFRHDSEARTLLKEDSDIGCVGTVNWMAPELIEVVMDDKGHYDNKVDIWSVGCTLVQMLTGSPPFHLLEQHQVVFKLTTGHCPEFSLPEFSSPDVKDFIKVTIEHNPKSRPSAESLLKNHNFLKEMFSSHSLFSYKIEEKVRYYSHYGSPYPIPQITRLPALLLALNFVNCFIVPQYTYLSSFVRLVSLSLEEFVLSMI
ncbi:Mitogen-activated protein kinase kinase kinase 5 [Bulinus truncatus]|nr:Mitogen-activated protein kinase kinase kinase 5 [Bulinus truncatus]